MSCLFCQEHEYPVSLGHTLIIPKKHIVDFFGADEQTRFHLFKLLDEAKPLLDEKYHPDGYNIGMNCQMVAGQSIMHLHIHLIPRYIGDTPSPKGGIRGVIPEKISF